jgi:hypothetical protein
VSGCGSFADGNGRDTVACSVPGSGQMPRANWTERLTAPFKFGAQELLPSAVKFGSAVTLTALMRRAAGQLGRQLLGHHMRYQVGCISSALFMRICPPATVWCAE